jgi:NAD(P)-dependent dehydrogenase (short-subunit alcohol dehydrogenase family)
MSKIAIITGASRGIGAATARLAARDGYDVCVNYVADSAGADAVVKACEAAGRRAIAVRADISKPEEVEAMFEACDKQLGPVSLLVNNAGVVGTATTVAELPDAALRETFEVNVFGTIYCARAAIRRMSTARGGGGGGGVIVNISSIAVNLGSPGEYVHYAASKGAIDSFTIGLAKEVGPEGIRVNAVQAGTTDTGIHAKAGNPDRPAQVAKLAPLRRIAEPEDTAEAVLYLASEKAGYATGAILRIGGGL